MKEIWKEIDGVYGKRTLYEVSNLGNVRSVRIINNRPFGYKPIKLNARREGKNYKTIEIVVSFRCEGKSRTYSVARLVADAFIPNEDNAKSVRHIDGNPYNNCVDNIAWANTYMKNSILSYKKRFKELEKYIDNLEKARREWLDGLRTEESILEMINNYWRQKNELL